jgi:hypothetical protein
MSSSLHSTKLSFHIPFQSKDAEIFINKDNVASLRQYTLETQRDHPEHYETMKRLTLKVAPIALAVIAAIATLPVWMFGQVICSTLLGSISWAIPATLGAVLWSECKHTVESFQTGSEPVFDFFVAGLTKTYAAVCKEVSFFGAAGKKLS